MNLYESRIRNHVDAFYFNGSLDGLDKAVDVRMMSADGDSRCSRCGSPMRYHARFNDGTVVCPCTYWVFTNGKMSIMGKDEFEGMYRKIDVEDAVWHNL